MCGLFPLGAPPLFCSLSFSHSLSEFRRIFPRHSILDLSKVPACFLNSLSNFIFKNPPKNHFTFSTITNSSNLLFIHLKLYFSFFPNFLLQPLPKIIFIIFFLFPFQNCLRILQRNTKKIRPLRTELI